MYKQTHLQIYVLSRVKTHFWEYVDSKGPDQPAHLCIVLLDTKECFNGEQMPEQDRACAGWCETDTKSTFLLDMAHIAIKCCFRYDSFFTSGLMWKTMSFCKEICLYKIHKLSSIFVFNNLFYQNINHKTNFNNLKQDNLILEWAPVSLVLSNNY